MRRVHLLSAQEGERTTVSTGDRVARAKKGAFEHICETCRPYRTFTKAEQLRRHRLSHETPKHLCNRPGCERAFVRADLLAQHMNRHEIDSESERQYFPLLPQTLNAYTTERYIPAAVRFQESRNNRKFLAPSTPLHPDSHSVSNASHAINQNSVDSIRPDPSITSQSVLAADIHLQHGSSEWTPPEFDGMENLDVPHVLQHIVSGGTSPTVQKDASDIEEKTERKSASGTTSRQRTATRRVSNNLTAKDLPDRSADKERRFIATASRTEEPNLTHRGYGMNTRYAPAETKSIIDEPNVDFDILTGVGMRWSSGPMTDESNNLPPHAMNTPTDQYPHMISLSKEPKDVPIDWYCYDSSPLPQDIPTHPYWHGQWSPTLIREDEMALNYIREPFHETLFRDHEIDMTKNVTDLVSSIGRTDATTDSGYGSIQGNRKRTMPVSNASVSISNMDSRTAFFQAPISMAHMGIYIFHIADELAAILPRSLPKELLIDLKCSLPFLLQTFAIRLGHGEADGVLRHFRDLVLQNRVKIAEAVANVFAFEEKDGATEGLSSPRSKDMSVADKMSLWEKPPQDVRGNQVQDGRSWSDTYHANDAFEDNTEFLSYSRTIINSAAFLWLQNAMLREIQLEILGTSNAQVDIRQKILIALWEQRKTSRPKPPKTNRLLFELPWFTNFFLEQEYNLPAYEALPRVLVLTGIHDQAWATTCLEYARTLWPQCGERILGLVAHLLRREFGAPSSCILDDDTQLDAKVDAKGHTLEILANGNAFVIAEVGEMLAWLQATFWTPPRDNYTVSVVPTCLIAKTEPQLPGNSNSQAETRCRFLIGKPVYGAKNNANCCWMKLFRNPVLVTGYPIPRHVEAHGGIELDLGTITELMGTKKVSRFNGKPLFKTGLAALVPMYRKNDFVYWHLIARTDGDYMSYCDEELKPFLDQAPESLSLADITRSRHIVGWSPDVHNVTGGPEANYDIKWSSLKPPSPGCVLEKISIVGGSYITAGVECRLGKKDKSVHIRSRDDYTMRLKWISKKYVVLYDVQDRRAWLVDGTSALLHLVRASLKHDASDPFKSSLLYDPNSLQEAPEHQSGKIASIEVLMNSHNISLPLYSKPTTSREETICGASDRTQHVTTQTQTYYCFQDRVQGIGDILEQIMAHQADQSTQDGIGFRLKASARRQLEGFDFMDVATDEDPFWPRMTTLKATGRGWVDFTRAIHAITLFGKGFGDLIQPVTPDQGALEPCGQCQLNTTVPKGQDCLAVCISELHDILQKRGSTETSPWRLVDDIYWHTPDKVFEICRCSKTSSGNHERMQVLLPSSMPIFWTRGLKSPINLDLGTRLRGAVLFGHSRRFPLAWKDHGHPEEGPCDVEVEDVESLVLDSGLGTSVTSTRADNIQDIPSSHLPPSPPAQMGSKREAMGKRSSPQSSVEVWQKVGRLRRIRSLWKQDGKPTSSTKGKQN